MPSCRPPGSPADRRRKQERLRYLQDHWGSKTQYQWHEQENNRVEMIPEHVGQWHEPYGRRRTLEPAELPDAVIKDAEIMRMR
jgi:hypothetical protein